MMEGALRLVLVRKLVVIVLAVAAISACDRLNAEFTSPVAHLVPHVLATYPHDPNAFTEGLFLAGGHLYESTGLNGQSTLREVDPTSGAVIKSVSLSPEDFGEGIAQVGSQIFQLTWQGHFGYIYDASTLTRLGTFPYNDDGWGMCYDGSHLYTSDGSDQLTERASDTLMPVGSVPVLYEGLPVDQINELECVDDSIYANVWHTNNILRIDKASGQVTALIDASNLLTAQQRSSLTSPEAVLNGIAYDPDHDDFYITGKLWPWMFEVQFVPAS